MFLRLETGRSDQIRPPGCNLMMPSNPPAGNNSEEMHITKRSRFSVSWLVQPPPSLTEVNCGVFME
jgi:hypothetical protein